MSSNTDDNRPTTITEPTDTVSFKPICDCGGVFRSLDDTHPELLYCLDCDTAVRYEVSYEPVSESELRAEREAYAEWMAETLEHLRGSLDKTHIPADVLENVDDWR